MSGKYHARKTTVNGIAFASALEARRYQQLLWMLEAGEIKKLKLQAEFTIREAYINPATGEKMRRMYYVADFVYFDNADRRWKVEDTKGLPTPQFKNKWRECQELFPEYDWIIKTAEEV